jgi:hypothetical protein
MIRQLIAITVTPFTALGWLIARASKAKLRRVDGAITAHGGALPWLLARHPFGPMAAVTIGRCVLARDRASLRSTFAHEAQHIRQFDRWGALFPLVYCFESLRAMLAGQGAYLGNRFEIAAETAARKKTRSM